MDKELESWKNENIKQTQLVEEEERSTEQSLQPFYTKMNDLDIQIKDQLSKINATKAKLIENDRAIHQMLCIFSFSFFLYLLFCFFFILIYYLLF